MRKIRKSKPPEQAIEQYTFYGTVVYTCPYCSAQLGGLRRVGGRRDARSAGRGSFIRKNERRSTTMTKREAIKTLESECRFVKSALADGTEHSKEAMDFVAACHIAVKALRENAYLKSQNSKLHSEVEVAVNDMQRLVIFSADPREICLGPGDCEICHFQWRGVEKNSND